MVVPTSQTWAFTSVEGKEGRFTSPSICG